MRCYFIHHVAIFLFFFFFFQAEDGIRDYKVTGVQTCALPILLGIFDAIAPAASAALQALDRGDVAGYRRALAPSVPLSRHIFQPPTYAYKTGVVFLAYLNGHQTHFRMLGGAEGWRSMPHLAELFRLADCAGLLVDPERAAERMRRGVGGGRGGGEAGGAPPPQTPPPAPGR